MVGPRGKYISKKMKYARDNYTLEQLEPRLMMDGAIDDMEGQEPPVL